MYGVLRFVIPTRNVAFRRARRFATRSADDSQELRTRLMSHIKAALKARDSLTASTLRSVLADVQAADKVHKEGQINASAVRLFIAKGIARRHDAASQYDKAKRPELAIKERQEALILQNLLPPAMSDSKIDEVLKQIIASLSTSTKQPSLGQLFKSFYTQVDKSVVRPDVLKQRALALLAAASSSQPVP